jgi:hypothetical protein
LRGGRQRRCAGVLDAGGGEVTISTPSDTSAIESTDVAAYSTCSMKVLWKVLWESRGKMISRSLVLRLFAIFGQIVLLGLPETVFAKPARNPIANKHSSISAVQPGQSIQAAIDAAPVNGVITLSAGTYTESVTLSKPVSILGAGLDKTIWRPIEYQRILTITAATPSGRIAIVGITFECGLATTALGEEVQTGCTDVHRPDPKPAGSRSKADNQGEQRIQRAINLTSPSAESGILRCGGNFDAQWNCASQDDEEIENCTNRPRGGAVCIVGPIAVEFQSVQFLNNRSHSWYESTTLSTSGALFVGPSSAAVVTNSNFISNTADYASIIFAVNRSLTVNKSKFVGNLGSFSGVYADGGSIEDSDFVNNTLTPVVGLQLNINRCRFDNNLTRSGVVISVRGDIGESSIRNSVFIRTRRYSTNDDAATIMVGGSEEPATIALQHNTMISHEDQQAIQVKGGQPHVRIEIKNMIFVDYAIGITRVSTRATYVVANSVFSDVVLPLVEYQYNETGRDIVAPGTFSGTALYTADPRLAPDGYHLLPDSPAIDAGAPGAPGYDIDGQYRPQRGAPDIGADEFYDAVPLSDFTLNCPPASAGLSLLGAQTNPPNLSRPVTYTLNAPGEPTRTFTGWTSDTLGVPWISPGAKTVTVTAANPLGSVTRSCAVAVSAAARVFWMPVVGR